MDEALIGVETASGGLRTCPASARPPRILFLGSDRWKKTWLPLVAAGATGRVFPLDAGWRSYLGVLRSSYAWGRAERPDLVLSDAGEVPTVLALWLARRLGVPSIQRLRGVGPRQSLLVMRGALSYRRWGRAAKLAVLHAVQVLSLPFMERVVADCRSTAEDLSATWIGRRGRIGWAHTPCPVGGNGAEASAVDARSPLIVTATNLECPDKFGGLLRRLDPVLAGLAARPSSRLRIYGDGTFRREFELELRRRHLPQVVEWAGWASSFRRDLREAACLVHLSDHDSYPSVILEAQAAGCPVLANDVGGVCEMIDDGVDGFVVRDDAEIADRLGRLLADPDLRARLARAGLARVRRENDERTIGDQLLRQMLLGLDARAASRA